MHIGLSLGLGGTIPAGSAWTPAALSPMLWYDPSDLTTLFQDAAGTIPVTADGQLVGRMDDKSGNGRHATQATAGKRPMYRTSGGLRWLEFDGVDDAMQSAFVLPLPFERVSAITLRTYVSGNHLISGVTSNTTVLYAGSPAPRGARIYAGAAEVMVGQIPTGPTISDEIYDGASSSVAFGSNSPTTGNPGITAGDGVTIGGSNSQVQNSAIDFYGMVISGVLTAPNRSSLRTYLGAKAGLTL